MLTVDDSAETVLRAIYKANERYANWSCGSWVSDAGVESVTCHKIAQEFADHPKRGGWSVELEVSYVKILELSGTPPRAGRPADLFRGSARADVAVFDGQYRPKFVVEVKRAWNSYAVWDDGRRLCSLMERCGKAAGGSLRAGILGVFDVHKPNSRRDPDAVDERQEEVTSELSAWGLKILPRVGKWEKRTYDDGEWRCRGLCYSIS